MFRAVSWICNSILIISAFGCSLLEQQAEQPKPKTSQVYKYEFNKVWRAAQIAIQDYPIAMNEMDRGVIETEKIKDSYAWNPPHNPAAMKAGRQYKLSLRITKGAAGKNEAVRVSVKKEIIRQKDFFTDPEKQESDGLEESVILYRIQRELEIERAIERASKNS